jgi:hypothetical protein
VERASSGAAVGETFQQQSTRLSHGSMWAGSDVVNRSRGARQPGLISAVSMGGQVIRDGGMLRLRGRTGR